MAGGVEQPRPGTPAVTRAAASRSIARRLESSSRAARRSWVEVDDHPPGANAAITPACSEAQEARRLGVQGNLAPLERAAAWWRARPWRHRHVVVSIAGAVAGSSKAWATARVTMGKSDGGPEARLDALEHNLGEFQKELDALRVVTQKDARELRARLEAEERARAATTSELAKQVEGQAVGAADGQLVGLAWFAMGSIYSTVPDDVVWFVRHVVWFVRDRCSLRFTNAPASSTRPPDHPRDPLKLAPFENAPAPPAFASEQT